MKNKKINKLKYIISILALLVGVIWFLWIPSESESQLEEQMIYPELDDISKSICGAVFSIRQSETRNGTHIIMLNKSQGFSISGVTSNRNYKNYRLFEFLQTNDSIYKPAKTDSIYIWRNNKKYFFIYGMSINIK